MNTPNYSYTNHGHNLVITKGGNVIASIIAGNLMLEQQAGIAMQICKSLNEHAALVAMAEAAFLLDLVTPRPTDSRIASERVDALRAALANLEAIRNGGGMNPAPREHLGFIEEYYDSQTMSAFGQYLGSRVVQDAPQQLGTEGRQIITLSAPLELKRSFSRNITIPAGKIIVRVVYPLQGKELTIKSS